MQSRPWLVVGVLLSATLLLWLTACDGGPTHPPSPNPQPQPAVKLVSVTVVGDTALERAGRYQYRSVALYSDGTKKDHTASAFWTYPNEDYTTGEVLAGGAVRLWALGTLRVTATFEGKTAVLPVRVTGTPWPEDMSEAVRVLVPRDAYGQVVRRDSAGDGVIRWWAQDHHLMNNQQVLEGLNFWTEEQTGRLSFVEVSDSAKAMVVVVFSEVPPTGHCGAASTTVIHLQARPLCMARGHVAHEMGHVFGFGHLLPESDIMGYPTAVWQSDPARKAALTYALSVPLGTIPVDE